MTLERLLALALAVLGAASFPFQTTPEATPAPIPPVVWAFYRARVNATDNCTVTLYTNRAVGSGECLLLKRPFT